MTCLNFAEKALNWLRTAATQYLRSKHCQLKSHVFITHNNLIWVITHIIWSSLRTSKTQNQIRSVYVRLKNKKGKYTYKVYLWTENKRIKIKVFMIPCAQQQEAKKTPTRRKSAKVVLLQVKISSAEKSKPHLVKLIWKVVIYRSYISIIIKLVKNKSA
jgi:DNA-binding transcriptional regulator of glucitol operon